MFTSSDMSSIYKVKNEFLKCSVFGGYFRFYGFWEQKKRGFGIMSVFLTSVYRPSLCTAL